SGLFLVEIILAVRAAFDSGGIRRRLSSAVCLGSQNFDRSCAAFFRRAAGVSTERPTTNSPPLAAGGNWYRSGSWLSLRSNGNWRWDISHAATAVLLVGAHSSSR